MKHKRKNIINIVPLMHDINFDEFDCGNASVNRYTRNLYYQEIMKLSSTKLIRCNNRIIGYYNINMCYIDADEETYSGICIKFIGIISKCQGKGIGTKTIKRIIVKSKEISSFIGCRYIIINALKEKKQWYLDRGFEYIDEVQLDDNSPTIKMLMDFQDPELINEYTNY